MGVNNTEVWNNIGLCCFYSSQYDMALGCFERALGMSGDDDMADVWYVTLCNCVFIIEDAPVVLVHT
jgi:hypothetical protein